MRASPRCTSSATWSFEPDTTRFRSATVAVGAPFADTIHLFRGNLERVCPTREALLERIRIVVLHETAHFFGYSEGQLRSMGLA